MSEPTVMHELCAGCDEYTEKAGAGDGSLYCAHCEFGPMCEDCAHMTADDCYCDEKCTELARLARELEKHPTREWYEKRCYWYQGHCDGLVAERDTLAEQVKEYGALIDVWKTRAIGRQAEITRLREAFVDGWLAGKTAQRGRGHNDAYETWRQSRE